MIQLSNNRLPTPKDIHSQVNKILKSFWIFWLFTLSNIDREWTAFRTRISDTSLPSVLWSTKVSKTLKRRGHCSLVFTGSVLILHSHHFVTNPVSSQILRKLINVSISLMSSALPFAQSTSHWDWLCKSLWTSRSYRFSKVPESSWILHCNLHCITSKARNIFSC